MKSGQNHLKKLSIPFDRKPHVKSGENCPSGFREEDIKKQDGGFGGHLGFPITTISAIFDLEVILLLQCKFQLKSPMVLEDKTKTGFQDGSCGGHLGFLIGKILNTFDLIVILMLQCKFQLKSPNGSGADIKIPFSRW